MSSQPSHSIRAHYDADTITLYQAYNPAIATSAVTSQCLSSSPLFNRSRTTWLKPSWNWMMYRSGYGHKDANQASILALKIRHCDFEELLSHAVIAGREKGDMVVVQWDPERDVRIQRLQGADVRSIQIGVKSGLVPRLVDEWVVAIEDVTERARELKTVLDKEDGVTAEELLERGLLPDERVYDRMLSKGVRERLGMNGSGSDDREGEGRDSRSRVVKRPKKVVKAEMERGGYDAV